MQTPAQYAKNLDKHCRLKYPKKDNIGRSAQIPGARSPWRLNLARWRLISVLSKKPVSHHPSQAWNFVVVLKLEENLCMHEKYMYKIVKYKIKRKYTRIYIEQQKYNIIIYVN